MLLSVTHHLQFSMLSFCRFQITMRLSRILWIWVQWWPTLTCTSTAPLVPSLMTSSSSAEMPWSTTPIEVPQVKKQLSDLNHFCFLFFSVGLKPVLSRTLWCLHEAVLRHWEHLLFVGSRLPAGDFCERKKTWVFLALLIGHGKNLNYDFVGHWIWWMPNFAMVVVLTGFYLSIYSTTFSDLDGISKSQLH